MLLRLAVCKRFTANSFLFRKERVYRVDEDYAAQLLEYTVNDMPVFRIILEDQLTEKDVVIDLSVVEEEEVAPAPRPKPKKVVENKEPTPNKKVVKKPAPKLKKATPPPDENVEMV